MPKGVYIRIKPVSEEDRKKRSERMIGNKHGSGNKGKKHLEESKRKMSEHSAKIWLGKHRSEETKRKIGKNNSKFWLGKKRSVEIKKKISESHFGIRPSLKTRLKMSITRKGRMHTEEEKRKIGISSTGRYKSEETKKKLSEAFKGNKSHFWKGGVSIINTLIRGGLEYRLWRKSVFERDDYKCRKCINGGYLHPHHIINFSSHPELRFAIDNGITFCKGCHLEFHKIYGNRNNTKEQLIEFLNKKYE